MLRILIRLLTPLSLGVQFTAIAAFTTMAASAPVPDDIAGEVQAHVNGKIISFPSLKTDVTADIQGDLAAVTVVQTFINPTSQPLNATYLFPLNKDAAVHAMQMQVADEIIEARIAKFADARKTFETAKNEGKAAALLEQKRPNMFTQNVANLMPGVPIVVTLKYVQTVPRVDGAYELVVPLVVGPRYHPIQRPNVVARAAGIPIADDAGSTPAAPAANGVWRFSPAPAYPPVNGLTAPPTAVDEDRVSLKVNLTAGVAIEDVTSTTHAIRATGDSNSKTRSLTLAGGRTIDNRDFIVRYTLAGTAIQAGLLAHKDETGGTLSLLIEPPAVSDAATVTPREMIFILDTSGSMNGEPIEASKSFMAQALRMLRSDDYFRIIRFSSSASELSAGPIPATPANLRAAVSFVNDLQANGGTEVLAGLRLAFNNQPLPGTHRMLVFLSDGYVSNEAEILNLVAAGIGNAHTYVLGVGTGVNRYLLAEMAHQGRGFMRIIDPTEKSEEAAVAFAKRLDATLMTDLTIDWGDLAVADVTPAKLPDLFAGNSLRVQARYTKGGEHVINIKGKIRGQEATLPVKLSLPDEATGEDTRAVPLIWARTKIKDYMRILMTPEPLRHGTHSNAAIEDAITKLGLTYHLATQWTSFVAVATKVLNPAPATTQDTDINLPKVKGVGEGAYPPNGKQQPKLPQPQHRLPPQQRAANPFVQTIAQSQHTFGGSSTPEPETLGGLAIIILGLLTAIRRRRVQLA